MRLFGDITAEDAEKDGQMLSELCRPGRSRTVVEVREHGWLLGHPSLYYIDMEYCPETLESRIHGNTGPRSRFDNGTEQFSNQPMGNPSGTNLSSQTTLTPTSTDLASEDTSKSPPEFDWESVVAIIEDINRGLVYIHKNHVVHRDLRPKNGTISF